jgi:hypothetical protein
MRQLDRTGDGLELALLFRTLCPRLVVLTRKYKAKSLAQRITLDRRRR